MTFHTWGNSVWNTKEVMRLTSRGRLGINTTTPTELLDVNGNAKISGTLSIGGYDSYYYLYNNTGGTHGDTSGDFNNITNFGHKFINGTANFIYQERVY